MSSGATHFGVVDQAIKSMKTVEEYIDVGMETTIDVVQDLVENDKENEAGVTELEAVMKSYIKMESDLHRFLEAVQQVRHKASKSRERLDLESLLDKTLEELPEGNVELLCQDHEKFKDFKERILEIQNPEDESVPALAGSSSTVDDDVAMTQPEVNTRCPYTGMEMKNPVKNKLCGHKYDKEGIMQHIKNKGKRAKCPINGCGNTKALDVNCLEEDRELKRYIERKQRGKRSQRT
ncbi:E3 SUMO-protein ligase NSE2-like isoform X1 [Pecten maximus]|uniref:E3 SUMO-protein ligase NSE2-like n=2 Tax=Pecten maximus TaxID=6579 RepID=UPI0014585F21|nr:E3 SUMO-protein ligase NSE2-like [Pecten maximus]XP_033726957.1 E3 SUMO-protein ligase NSE2-like [Pecten maximus]XP_033731384.1 E3 SUMO-protein ligase NSE2-like isoform X1 [Pecten maximus]XP_033731385.1 E3 SUMO-protein ligase NSE2-like isoform X1 [Pecten maximus]XP_033731386.1 E3 SUMO-protein ligase NSE2-like isoform X1 [Pecten maximus]